MTIAAEIPRGRWIAFGASLLPILVLTLSPGPSQISEPLSMWCVVCGWRGASDALLNVALFAPFGAVLSALGLRVRTVLLTGFVFSVGIELVQFLVPNRFPGLGDVIYNAAGAALGGVLYAVRDRILLPKDRLQARRRTWSWGLVGVLLLGTQAWLLGPSIPQRDHLIAWTSITPWETQYEGQVLRFSVDGSSLPPGPVEATADLVGRIVGGADMEVLLRAGPRAPGIVPLVLLTDSEMNEDLFIGLDGDDILVKYRTNGMALHLDRPLARWRRGAVTWAEGDTVTLRIEGVGGGIVLDHVGGTAVPEFPSAPGPIELKVPTARGWAFLMYPRFVARRSGASVDLVWMLLLAFPLGLWGAPRAATVCAAGWVGALYFLPSAFPLLEFSTSGSLGVPAGIIVGLLARLIYGNPEPFKWWKPLYTIYDPGAGERDADADPSEESEDPIP